MNMDMDVVHQFTGCPGGKRTSSKEVVLIFGTKRTIEHIKCCPIHAVIFKYVKDY